ncbi:MAG: hypothetical protein AB8G16_03170 [Gammaproteobacteria bacterium]
MPEMNKPMMPLKGRPGLRAKSANVNFFFTQDSSNLKRKWAERSNFWTSTRPEQSNEAPRWEAFESWRGQDKPGS